MATPAEIRARAARVVAQVSARGRSLEAPNRLQGSAQERGLLSSLAYGTIRWQIRIDAFLDRWLLQPRKEMDPELRALLSVGLFQLLHTDIAQHAAVAETVEATRSLKMPRAAKLVNALLRRCQREAALLAPELDRDDSIRTAHPPWFVAQLKRDWPEKYAAILDANNAHPPMWLRVNERKTSVEEYLARLGAVGLRATRSPLAAWALCLETPVDVHTLPGFSDGLVSIQDAAAQLAAPLLDPDVGHRVLDACAAPGGKTCHLLELQPECTVTALDIDADRLRRVQENLDRIHVAATLLKGDAIEPKPWWDGRRFDRILLDVPCSATGVIRRHPDIKLLRRSADIADLQRRQRALLRSVWPLLEPGGYLLYASCSALRAETCEVISGFLEEESGARDRTAARLANLGIDSLATEARTDPGLTIHAGQAQMDGFYYACLEKHN